MMVWTPRDLSLVCPVDSNQTACTNSGYVYLMLLAQLFGGDHISQTPVADDPTIYQRGPWDSARGFHKGVGRHGCQNSFDGNTRSNKKKRKEKEKGRVEGAEEYDFIIVGAGSAGCVLANRLSEISDWKILLLEAGPEEPDVASVPALAPALAASNIDWSFQTVPDGRTCTAELGGSCFWPRGKVMGGSSVLNYMVYVRGNARDYDEWAQLGNHGWSYSDVLPYFRKSENNRDREALDRIHHGVGGYLNVERFPYRDKNSDMLIEGFVEMGLPPNADFNGVTQVGVGEVQTTSKDGQRYSSNTAFLRPIRHVRHNLVIRTEAEVTKVLIDSLTKTANGVTYIKNESTVNIFATKEVIVCAGSINSPKLLMLSGIGPKEDLEAFNIEVLSDLDVGKNLHDHPAAEGAIVSLSNLTSTAVSDEELKRRIYEYKNATRKTGPLASTGTTLICAYPFNCGGNEDINVPNVVYLFIPKKLKDFFEDPTLFSATQIFPFSFYDSFSSFAVLFKPKSRGYITLNQDDPIFGPAAIHPNFYSDPEDVQNMIDAIKYVFRLERTMAFRRNGASFVREPLEACEDYEWGSNEYWVCMLLSYTSDIFHPVGTCKMGPAFDQTAVVSRKLKVYGIKGLRVADGSIMPVIVRGNTNAPIIMIAEKASDMIKSDWQRLV